MKKIIGTIFFLFLSLNANLFAQPSPLPSETSTPGPVQDSSPNAPENKTNLLTPTPDLSNASFEQKKEALELQRLELENEKLKLEMDQLKAQSTQTVTDTNSNPEEKKEAEDGFQREMSKKAEELAKENKEKSDLLVLDLVNGEVWDKGVRYSVHELYDMADDLKIKVKKSLDKRDRNGDERNLYVIQNASLLRYSGRPRGIFDIKVPAKEGDFRVMTTEGISFDSTIGDVRNAYQGVYFKYEGQANRDKLKWLRYKHSGEFLSFSDKLEFGFDKDGKLMEIRYGVLDEN